MREKKNWPFGWEMHFSSLSIPVGRHTWGFLAAGASDSDLSLPLPVGVSGCWGLEPSPNTFSNCYSTSRGCNRVRGESRVRNKGRDCYRVRQVKDKGTQESGRENRASSGKFSKKCVRSLGEENLTVRKKLESLKQFNFSTEDASV